MGSSVHRPGKLADQLRHGICRVGIFDLTSSCRRMSTAAVRKAELADIDRRASVDDRLADGEDSILLLDAPEDMHGHPAPRKQPVDHESIARINGLLFPKIEDDKVFVNAGAAQDLLTKLHF